MSTKHPVFPEQREGLKIRSAPSCEAGTPLTKEMVIPTRRMGAAH